MKQVLLLLSFIFFAQCIPYPHAISKGTPIPKPTYWKHLGRANPGQRFPLFYALKQKNIDKIEEIALEVSDPDHPKYGKHLSLEEVSEIVSPEEGSITQLISWLDSKGVREVTLSGSKSFLKVEVSIQKAEELLGCNFQNFEFTQTEGEVISRCLTEYYVPEELDSIVEFVAPVHGFPSKTLRSHRNKLFENGKLTQSVPLTNVTADQVLTRYNVTKKLDLKVNNTQAVYEFGMSYLLSDLNLFFQTYLPYLEGQTVVKFLGNESNDPNNEGDEASLDIQLLMGVGQYAPSYSYTYGGNDLFYSFYQWAFDLDSDPKPPLTHSNSWGPTGGGYPIPEIVKASNELAKLAVRGLTILIASGDDGPGCYPPAPFEVAYPTTPWVTLVGSTQLQATGPTTLTEIGSNFSSGGFSNYWTRPKWQGAPVDNYLRNTPNLPTSEWYNASKRAFPDISAVGENIWIFSQGSAELVSGTSASAPIVAGIFSQLNGIRLRAGKSPLGYLNPLLYKLVTTNPELFFDVTAGSDDQGIDGCPYWPATKGWDPVTGVGTPNFKTWAKFVLTLP